jgi:hypothetical protein
MTSLRSALIPAEAVADYERLLRAIADTGGLVPCCTTDPSLWCSDSPDDRALAASLCSSCPAIVECRNYAVKAGEAHHVWGGRDRTPKAGRPRAQSAPAPAKPKRPARNTGQAHKSRQRSAGRHEERKTA